MVRHKILSKERTKKGRERERESLQTAAAAGGSLAVSRFGLVVVNGGGARRFSQNCHCTVCVWPRGRETHDKERRARRDWMRPSGRVHCKWTLREKKKERTDRETGAQSARTDRHGGAGARSGRHFRLNSFADEHTDDHHQSAPEGCEKRWLRGEQIVCPDDCDWRCSRCAKCLANSDKRDECAPMGN